MFKPDWQEDCVACSHELELGQPNHAADLQRKSFFGGYGDGPVNGAPLNLQRISDYEFSRKLGQGAFGKVWLAKEVASGNTVAIKTLKKSFLVTTGLWRRSRRGLRTTPRRRRQLTAIFLRLTRLTRPVPGTSLGKR